MTDAGHVRMANRLVEAIISAPFHEAHLKIVLTIFRLSAGWQRQSVNASLAELAEYCGYRKPTGGFRDQLKELIVEGVIVLASEGGGATRNGYGLQEDFERWGKFAQSVAKLEAIWGKRPDHSDQLPLQILTLHPASIQAGSDADPASTQAGGLPPHRQGACLHTGRVTPSNRRSANRFRGWKDRKDRKDRKYYYRRLRKRGTGRSARTVRGCREPGRTIHRNAGRWLKVHPPRQGP